MGKGHAVHFLERLKRLPPADVELALGLYRDAPLVKSVLSKASLPSGNGRVAMAIGREDNGPWLVVGRDGGFVTCLGAGMKHDLPVVRRDQLDAISTFESKLRACIQAARDLTGAERPSMRFIADALHSGRGMSRERFLAFQALEPVMQDVYLDAAHESARQFCVLTDRLLKVERFGSKHIDLFAEREQLAWKMAHLFAASVDEIRSATERMGREGPYYAWVLCAVLFSSGYLGPAYRALWLAARLGPSLMPHLREIDDDPGSTTDRLYAPIALAAIGVAHLELRGEVLKRLKRRPDWTKNAGEAMREVGVELRSRLVDVVVDERHPDREPRVGRAFLHRRGMTLENTAPELFNQLARAHQPNFEPVVGVLHTAVRLAQSAGWVATMPGADLNLPESAAAHVPQRETSLEEHVEALKTTRLIRPFEAPEPRPAHGEGRNARCPCGSGKKRKRCCGAATAA